MKKLSGLSIKEVRRRVRQHLLAEASISLTSAKGAELVRQRGGEGAEASSAAMDRFRKSLVNAEAGDVFFLTYGIAEYKPLSDKEREATGSGSDDLRFSTEMLDRTINLLMGKHGLSEEELNRLPAEEREREENLKSAASSYAESKRLIDLGMSKIRSIQTGRIKELSEIQDRIRSGSSTRYNLVDKLKSIIDLDDSLVLTLRAKDQLKDGKKTNPRKEAMSAIIAGMGKGEVRLSAKYIESENELISAAQLIAYGNRMHDLSDDMTGIPGTVKYAQDRMVPKDLGKSTEIRKDLTGVGGERPDGELDVSDQKYDPTDDVINILIGGCVTLLNFDGPQIKIRSGDSYGRLERSGLPLPVLHTIVNLLLWEITYPDSMSGDAGHLSNLYKSSLHNVSTIFWANHMDPAHSIEVASGFVGAGDNAYKMTASGKMPRQGSRVNNHWDDQTDRILSLAASALGDKINVSLKNITDDDVKAILARVKEAGIDVGEDVLRKILGERERARTTKIAVANLANAESKAAYDSSRRWTKSNPDPASLAEKIAIRANSNESERKVYENILRRLLFGVTLRCVGKGAETRILTPGKTAVTLASVSGASAATKSTFPIFEAKIERPKQTWIRTVQNADDLKKMTFSSMGLTDFKPAKGGSSPLETSKLGSASEATRAGRSSTQHRSEIVTPNMKVNLTDLAIKKAIAEGSVQELLSDPANYRVSKPFKVPYVEKHTTYKANMTVEDVMALESAYDRTMNPLRVTVQLLGAKKFHDSDHENKPVTRSYLNPIPEMGIVSVGDIPAEGIELKSDTRKRIKDNIARTAADLAKIKSDPASFQSFDLRDRVIQNPNSIGSSGTLRSKIQELVRKLDNEISESESFIEAARKSSTRRKLLRDLRSSHGADPEVFESRINSRIVIYALGAIRAEAQKIRNGEINVKNLKTIDIAVNSSQGFGGLLGNTSGLSAETKMGLQLAAEGLKAEVTRQALVRLPSFSYGIIAALETNTKSVSEVSEKVLEKSNSGDPASLEGRPAAAPLYRTIENARSRAGNLLTALDTVGVEGAISALIGTKRVAATPDSSSASRDEADLDSASTDPTGIGQTVEELSGKLQDLDSSSQKREAEISQISKMIKDAEKIASDFSASDLGRKLSSKQAPASAKDWSPSTVNGTSFGMLLKMADASLVPNKSVEEAVEAIIQLQSQEQDNFKLRNAIGNGEALKGFMNRLNDLQQEMRGESFDSASILLDTAISAAELTHSLQDAIDVMVSESQSKKEEAEQPFAEIRTTLNEIDLSLGQLTNSLRDRQSVVERIKSEKIKVSDMLLNIAPTAALLEEDVAAASETLQLVVEALVGTGDSKGAADTISEMLVSSYGADTGSSSLNKALDSIKSRRATSFTQDPRLVSKNYDETINSVGLTPDQLALAHAAIVGANLSRMGDPSDPYVAAQKIAIGLAKAQTMSAPLREIFDGIRDALFPFFTPEKFQELISRGSGMLLSKYGYESAVNARAKRIYTALKQTQKAKAAALEGDTGASNRLALLGDYIQSAGWSQILTIKQTGTESQGEQESTVPVEPYVQSSSRARVSPAMELQQRVASRRREDASTPFVRGASTGEEPFERENTASYMSVVKRLEDAVSLMKTDPNLKPLKIHMRSMSSVISDIESDKIPLSDDQAATIKQALDEAKILIEELDQSRGTSTDLSALMLGAAADTIRTLISQKRADRQTDVE